MAIIQDWKIRSRAHRCIDTERDFEDGECVVTGIFADPESDGYLRKDFCLEAWERLKTELQPFSFWQGTYHAPEPEHDPQDLGKESPEAMLRRMIDDDESYTENARYILALMLERKKILIPVDTQELESRRMLFYEHKENGDVFVVADPQLHLDQIEAVQEEVALLLQGKKAPNETESGEESISDPNTDPDSQSETEPAAESSDDETEPSEDTHPATEVLEGGAEELPTD
jgi:hypothetical protein